MSNITYFFKYLTSFFYQDDTGEAVWRGQTGPNPQFTLDLEGTNLNGMFTDWSVEEVPYAAKEEIHTNVTSSLEFS